MANGNFHASFDERLFSDYVALVGKGNIKRTLQEYMENALRTSRKDVEGINIKLLNIDIETIQKQIQKLSLELQEKQQLKNQYNEIVVKKEQERLQKEKETIEKQKTCLNCGKTVNDIEKRLFNAGAVCRSCYLGASKEDVQRWMKKE